MLELPGCRLSLHLLRHAAPNCGIRLETPDASLAYTGDTGPCAGLVPLAREVDLLLAEATLQASDTGAHGHLSAAEAGSVAAGNGVGELVLTHVVSADPAHLDAQRAAASAVFDGPVRTAQPGMRFRAGAGARTR